MTNERSSKSKRLHYQPALYGIWNRRSHARSVCMCVFMPCGRLLAGETHVHIKWFHWSRWYDWRWKNRAATCPPLLRCCCCELSATILTESTHVIIKTACQFNTAAYKAEWNTRDMIRVDIIDLDVSVCEAHDINSVFNTRNFTRFYKCLHEWAMNQTMKRKEREGGE